ncbi:hypothetical protein MBM_09177 [Drepanopeziza brunnea f. sp. 'multigermtubi' MB_m1]|uniref:Uncharacterized protein n=1 Tax=Marssonina brunnea f. sp. multigermtubi (strain MB_m1) TaxID=1072389 RepID=K1WVD0_MARBU|nr:uncharacterized protein MBM_09177 [Drepanopeziza brunnea f. sp. 'multigermtubi' MB_m1]EKD12608.1 hypothetical protein MBM_09177 [Drepanopeziza brunnea f. sp. 'multigermtubi' MB_m1]
MKITYLLTTIPPSLYNGRAIPYQVAFSHLDTFPLQRKSDSVPSRFLTLRYLYTFPRKSDSVPSRFLIPPLYLTYYGRVIPNQVTYIQPINAVEPRQLHTAYNTTPQPGNMQSIDPQGGESGRQGASGTSAKAQTTGIQAPRISTTRADLLFRSPAQPPNPGTRNTLEAPDGDALDLDNYASDLGFDLDSLPYSKPESHTKARLIIEDFLDIKTSIVQIEKEHQWTWKEQREQSIEGFDSKWNDITIARLNRQTKEVAKIQGKQRKERIEEATRHKEELEAAKAAKQSSRRSSRSSRDSLPSPVPLLLQPAILSPKEHAREYDEPLKVEEIPGNFYSHQGQRGDLRPRLRQPQEAQTYRGHTLKEEIRREEDQGNGYRQGRAQGYEQKREQALAGDPSDPDSSNGDPERGNKRGNEWNRHGRRGGGHGGPTRGQGNEPPRDPGQENEPPRDPGRGYEPPGEPGPNRPLTGTPFSTRVIANTYSTPGAPDDDDDFPELGAADPHPRAKELALFAKSFPKELKYSGPDDDFKTQLSIFADQASRYGLTSDDYLAAFPIMLTKEAITFYYNHVIKARLPTFKANAIASIQSSLRPSLKDDKSLADKLYSACKNVPKTIIARMNPAITSTAAVADIRKAIAFATETSRPPAKTSRAYASSSEPHDQHSPQHSPQHSSQHTSSKADSDDLKDEYECFIQGCQYGGEHCEHFAR